MKKITLLIAFLFTTFLSINASSENLIQGGDFDRANWRDYDTPEFWSFTDTKVLLVETASYPGNKGWMYIDITPKANGKMSLYRENDDMKIEYNCIQSVTPAKYQIDFWAKSEKGSSIKISLPWFSANGKSGKVWTSPEIKIEGDWKKYTVFSDVAPAGTTSSGLEVTFLIADNVVSFDDFVVYADNDNHAAGEILIDGKNPSEKPNAPKNDTSNNLIQGGDFDRANWRDYDTPEFWSFIDTKVLLVETPSYPGNKGWMYVDITPKANGKMSLYKENDDMKMEYISVKLTSPAKYQIDFWAKSAEGSSVKINMPWFGANGKSEKSWTSPEIKISGDWRKYTVFTDLAPEGTTGVGLEVIFLTADKVVSFDDFAVYTDVENHKAGEIVDGDSNDGDDSNPDDGNKDDSDNLFAYGDFEQINPQNKKPMGWYIASTALYKFSDDIPTASKGKQSFCVYPGESSRFMTNEQGVENILKVVEDETYILTFWAKGNNANDKFSARFSWYGNDELVGEPQYVAQDQNFTTEWKLYSYEVKVPWDVNSASFAITFSTDNDYVFFDDIVMTLKRSETGVSSVVANNSKITVADGKLLVNVQQPSSVKVFDLSGKLVYSEMMSASAIVELQKGAYLVKAGNQTSKVVIK